MVLPNGAELKPGSYEMKVPVNSQSPEVAFYKDGELVAKAEAKVVAESIKNPYTAVESTEQGKDQLITSIRPGGWREKLVFSGNSEQMGNGGQ
jgi:hypothetical protein